MALDKALETGKPGDPDVEMATDVLTLSVLAIVICAPVGATCMTILGPKFLVKEEDDIEQTIRVIVEEEKANSNGNTTENDAKVIYNAHDNSAFVSEEKAKSE